MFLLWNAAGNAPGDLIKCLSCHSPHGGQPDTEINTLAFNSSHKSFLPLGQVQYRYGTEYQMAAPSQLPVSRLATSATFTDHVPWTSSPLKMLRGLFGLKLP